MAPAVASTSNNAADDRRKAEHRKILNGMRAPNLFAGLTLRISRFFGAIRALGFAPRDCYLVGGPRGR